MRRSTTVFCAAALLLAACARVDEPPAIPLPRVDVEEMDVSFAFHEPLTLRASENEALLSGPTTRIQVETRPYALGGRPAQQGGLGAWDMPAEIARAVRDERSCAPLQNGRVYLPVDTALPLRCDLVLDPAGRTVVWMVGIGRPFEEVAFMQSAMLVLEEERFHVLSYLYPFPEADATAQWLEDSFVERHPNMSKLIWPNKSYKLLMEEVQGALSREIDPPSAEVRTVMEDLRAVAFSVGPSRALADR